jgi:asparagine synthase (glutamine-hydrolysing)
MVDEASGAVVAFNGEIYNYVELRDELEREGVVFHTGCDTEVLLKSYVRWGSRCVERFNGMWAFVVWDPRVREAFFARDRFGVKPFVYTLVRDRLSIASEPKALLHAYPELRRVDERTLHDFLAFGRLPTSERSMYDGISVLPPAHAGILRTGESRPEIWPYWKFPDSSEPDPNPVERFSELLTDSVRLRMRSDVGVGVALSGGLDSTAVLHGAVQALPQNGTIRAFTSVFPASSGPAQDERSWAEEAARRYTRVALEYVPVPNDWVRVMERMAWHLDAPTFSSSAVSLWTIVERARSHDVKVLLEGQGADELLGGYVQHAALAIAARGGIGIRRALRESSQYATTFRPYAFVLWLLRERFPALRHVYRSRRGTGSTLNVAFANRFRGTVPAPPANSLRQRLIDDLSRDILPAILHYGDGVSMAHSLETRQPFLDYRLVEYCTQLPDAWKVGDGETKRILRAHLRSIGQDRVASRRDKLGFPTPVWAWLMAEDALVPRTLLLGADSQITRYCSRSALESLIARARRDRRTGADHLFRLVSTELWLRVCIG